MGLPFFLRNTKNRFFVEPISKDSVCSDMADTVDTVKSA